MDRAIADQEEEYVVASRPGSGKRGSRGSNPRVVAVVRLDREVKVVPGLPPPLEVRDLDSPKYTESAPEFDLGLLEETAVARSPKSGEEPARAIELEDDVMDADGEGSTTEGAMGISPKGSAARSKNKKKSEHTPGSGSGPDKKASSSKRLHAMLRMKRSKTDLDDSEWELSQNPGRRSSYLKKPRILATRAELGLTAKQWQMVREKVELFGVSSTADIAAEASWQLDLAENARRNSMNIKGDLNNQIKMGIIIAKHAVYKLAERSTGMGDMAARDRIMILTRGRDLRKEVENLKRQRESREETPSQLEVIKEDGWVIGWEEMPTKSARRITRSRANLVKRRLQTSDSESGGPGVAPLRSGMNSRGAGGASGRPIGSARAGPLRGRIGLGFCRGRGLPSSPAEGAEGGTLGAD